MPGRDGASLRSSSASSPSDRGNVDLATTASPRASPTPRSPGTRPTSPGRSRASPPSRLRRGEPTAPRPARPCSRVAGRDRRPSRRPRPGSTSNGSPPARGRARARGVRHRLRGRQARRSSRRLTRRRAPGRWPEVRPDGRSGRGTGHATSGQSILEPRIHFPLLWRLDMSGFLYRLGHRCARHRGGSSACGSSSPVGRSAVLQGDARRLLPRRASPSPAPNPGRVGPVAKRSSRPRPASSAASCSTSPDGSHRPGEPADRGHDAVADLARTRANVTAVTDPFSPAAPRSRGRQDRVR